MERMIELRPDPTQPRVAHFEIEYVPTNAQVVIPGVGNIPTVPANDGAFMFASNLNPGDALREAGTPHLEMGVEVGLGVTCMLVVNPTLEQLNQFIEALVQTRDASLLALAGQTEVV